MFIICGLSMDNTCEGNNCCMCGVCQSLTECHNCPCRGPSSEGCHHRGWNMSTPECNLSVGDL